MITHCHMRVNTAHVHENTSKEVVFLGSEGVAAVGLAWGREGASSRHRHVRVGILGLWAGEFIEAVRRPVRIEFSVHVPAELLSGGLWVVELLLGLAFHRLELVLKDLELLLSLSSRLLSIGIAGVALSGLLGDGNHYEI